MYHKDVHGVMSEELEHLPDAGDGDHKLHSEQDEHQREKSPFQLPVLGGGNTAVGQIACRQKQKLHSEAQPSAPAVDDPLDEVVLSAEHSQHKAEEEGIWTASTLGEGIE